MNPLVLTTLFLFSAALAQASQSGAMYAKQFAKVERKVDGDLMSSGTLMERIDSVCEIFKKRAAGLFGESSKMLAAGEKFGQLQKIINSADSGLRLEDFCRQGGLDILVPNYKASEGLPKLRSLVTDVAELYGRFCESFFTNDAMYWLRSECKGHTHWNVAPYMAKKLAPQVLGVPFEHRISKEAIEASRYKANEVIRGLKARPVDSQLAESLGRLLRDNVPAGNLHDTDPDLAADDFDEFLVKPCEAYVTRIGPKYFEPLAIVLETFGRDLEPTGKGTKSSALSNIADLYEYWLSYRICQLYILPNARKLVRGAPSVAKKIVRG